jgi:hypothetical protein
MEETKAAGEAAAKSTWNISTVNSVNQQHQLLALVSMATIPSHLRPAPACSSGT